MMTWKSTWQKLIPKNNSPSKCRITGGIIVPKINEQDIRAVATCPKSGCTCRGKYGNVHCPLPNNHKNADRTPSLTVKTIGDKLLIHCFNDCAFTEIMDAFRARGV